MLFRLALATLLIACLAVGRLYALCAGTTFEWQIQHTKLIFAGTVTKAEAVEVPGSIVTRYRFDEVRYVKGSGPADSMILVEDGGCHGRDCVYFSEGVSFQVGTRYVVFADSGSWSRTRDYGSMLCGTGHPFTIRADSGSTTPVVHFSGRAPLAGFDDRHMVIVGTWPWEPSRGGAWSVGPGRMVEPSRPPSRPLGDVIRDADTELESKIKNLPSPKAEEIRNQMQLIHLYPHQDPGSRVTEGDFLDTLSRIVSRASSESDSSKGG